jgi:hypothetical protein
MRARPEHILAALALAIALPAHAGQGCREEPLSVDEVRRSLALAQRTYAALDASGAVPPSSCATTRPAAGPSCMN